MIVTHQGLPSEWALAVEPQPQPRLSGNSAFPEVTPALQPCMLTGSSHSVQYSRAELAAQLTSAQLSSSTCASWVRQCAAVESPQLSLQLVLTAELHRRQEHQAAALSFTSQACRTGFPLPH